MSNLQFADIQDFRPDPEHPTFVSLEVSRAHVERNDIQTWIDVLERLTASEPIASAYEGMLSIAVTGYEDDPRELYEIPEVVGFMRELTASWPYWFHFCERYLRSLDLIFICHIDLRRVQNFGEHKIGVTLDSPDQFRRALMDLFNGMNGLYEEHGWSNERNETASDLVNAALKRWTGS